MTTYKSPPAGVVDVRPKTVGLSPKAYVPFVALVLAGVVCLLLDEQDVGFALLAAALGQGGIAYVAKPGKVQSEPKPAAPAPV